MESAANGSKLPGRTVLVVDDEEHVRTALTRLLEREGYGVTAVDGPTEALEILRNQPIKLVISDNNMPDMTGIEFFRLIRERHPHVCRIMLTADSINLARDADTGTVSLTVSNAHFSIATRSLPSR